MGNSIQEKEQRLVNAGLKAYSILISIFVGRNFFYSVSLMDDFHFNYQIPDSLGGSTLPGRNENMEIINRITHVQKRHIRARRASYPGSLFTESQWVMRKVEITRKYFGTLM